MGGDRGGAADRSSRCARCRSRALVDTLASAAGRWPRPTVEEVIDRRSPASSSPTPPTASWPWRSPQVVQQEHRPDLVLWPHTYQTREFAPRLAARLDRSLADSPTASASSGATARAGLRPSDVSGEVRTPTWKHRRLAPHFASLPDRRVPCRMRRGAATRRRRLRERCTVTLDAAAIRQSARGAVQGGEAGGRLHAGGTDRGGRARDQGREHLSMWSQELARALDAEVAASRPICDAGWLPMDRQIGSSGQTVAPRSCIWRWASPARFSIWWA